MMAAKEAGQPYDRDAYASTVRSAVSDIVRRQAETGVDILYDGEQSKPGFFTYVSERLTGFEPLDAPQRAGPWEGSREVQSFPEYYELYARGRRPSVSAPFGMVCTGPVTYRGQEQIKTDLDNLKAALQGVNAEEVFVPSSSATNVEAQRRNDYYPSDEAYLQAIADAMREEYHAILDAGFLLQIDDPRLVTFYVSRPDLTIEECRKWAELRVEVLNYALRDIPPERVRFHTCYGINIGPRSTTWN